MSKTAYLAYPIDNVSPGAREYIQDVSEALGLALRGYGYNYYTPGRAWTVGNPEPDPLIEQVNNAALFNADLVVAFLPRGTVTIGVPMEIERARVLGIPVIVMVDDSKIRYSLVRDGIRVVVLLGDDIPAIETARILDALAWAEKQPRREDDNDLRVVLTGPDAAVPTRAYDDDAGIDLYTAKDISVEPGDFVDIHTTVEKTQLPIGYWGMIVGRSSTLRMHRLHIPPAVIDPGWRGPLFVGAWNLGGNPVHIKAGQRIGQLILVPNNPAAVRVVEQLDDSVRGVNGFGSSG